MPRDQNSSTIVAFLDTNVLLHYRALNELDWLQGLSAQTVKLKIPAVVVGELDKKKFEATGKIRARAMTVIKMLQRLSPHGDRVALRNGVELDFVDCPASFDYAAHHLDVSSKDDQLLACVLEYSKHNAADKVMVVTADLGLKLKASHRGLTVIAPPENSKIPEEADPNEKRIQELERELLELKRAAPQLDLAFADGLTHWSVSLSPTTRNPDQVQEGKRRIREKHPLWNTASSPSVIASESRLGVFLDIGRLFSVSPQAIDTYNERLNDFYKEYDNWLEICDFHQMILSRQIRLDICVQNTGTKPAEDVELFLHFPDGFLLLAEEDCKSPPNEPIPPDRPKSGLDEYSNLGRFRMPDIRPMAHDLQVGPPSNVSNPRIRETNSFEVGFDVQRVKHNLPVPLDPLFVLFRERDSVQSFGIDYQMHAANLPKPVQGRLDVIVAVETG